MDFRYRIQLSVRSWLPRRAERRYDHDRILRAYGQRRVLRHEFYIRLVRDRRFLRARIRAQRPDPQADLDPVDRTDHDPGEFLPCSDTSPGSLLSRRRYDRGLVP